MYPRWKVNSSEWWQYGFLIAALFLFALAWQLRTRWRGPLAGLLFFVATLLPLLGFFNISFFRFSFVADHFQYLPIIGIITPLSAGAVLLLNRFGRWQQLLGYVLCAVLLIILAALSWMHSRVFRDSATCYRAVVELNPSSWAAQINLGFDALARQSWDEAADRFQKVLETNPDYPPAAKRAHLALSAIMLTSDRTDEATTHIEKALQIDPTYAEAHANLAGKQSPNIAAPLQSIRDRSEYISVWPGYWRPPSIRRSAMEPKRFCSRNKPNVCSGQPTRGFCACSPPLTPNRVSSPKRLRQPGAVWS